mgnify:CR=1 FL=1
MTYGEPYDTRCTNPGLEDRFTCPGCYEDHFGDPEEITRCEKCKRKLRCSIETQPVAVCELAEDDEESAG